jgi:hypothetical protein
MSATVSRPVMVVLMLGAVIAGAAGAFRSQDSSGTGPASPLATQPVVREDLPSAGQVIRQGQVLYRWITAAR